MSAPVVEARSLSLLTALASNPPSYPRNPTHVKHDPLVLYIARVPGSRDVFLTPMKPREKVVTAEDITSSLYFVHVELPEDARFMDPPPSFHQPDYSEERPLPPVALRPAIQPQTAAVQRKAIPSPPAAAGMPAAPRRKPVPGTLAPTNDFESRYNVSPASYSPSSPSRLGPDYTAGRSFDSIQRTENERPPLPVPRPSEQPHPSGTRLTLIRRDPASGAQWNVACIDDPQVPDISPFTSNESPPKKKIGAPVYIDVTNPGYSKFLHTEHMNASIKPTQAHVPGASLEQKIGGETGTFRRRLWMEGSKYAGSDVGHRRINSHDPSAFGESPRDSVDWPRERSSMDVRPHGMPPFSPRENQSYSTIQASDKQSSFRGYVFMSPWNGRCEFVTGAAGGFLKCRHLIPGLQGAPPISMPVSELRFNLPSSSKATTPRGEESSKRSSFFHRPRHNRRDSPSADSQRADSTEDVRSSFDRMDLSLGQEFAGGGFGGKQAKLGKLIIEDEGLKMVDLLVAANLALWWRAYEKGNKDRPR